ncbi:hypothetical protein ACXGQW_05840 [Wenyingzhuangia sp. IMCC45533]
MKNSLVAAALAFVSLLALSDLDFFKTVLWFPNFLWILPFYLFFRISVSYFVLAFQYKGLIVKKLGLVGINSLLIAALLYLGFQLWRSNQGNILSTQANEFHITLKNIWFWIVYQSQLLLLFFSAFKLLVTIDQK